MFPVISIVIPSYNSFTFIQNWEYRNNPNFFKRIEFVFIDSNTDENSKKILEYLQETYLNFKFISQKTNLYEAMNLGIDYATGKYVAFMGVDDKLVPDINNFIDLVIDENIDGPDLFISDLFILYNKKNKLITKKRSSKDHLLFPHHQSCFFKLNKLRETNIKYDSKFKIYSDLDFILNFSYQNPPEYINYSCIEFSTGGKSTNGQYFLQSIFEIYFILKKHKKLFSIFFFMSMLRISFYYFKSLVFHKKTNYIN
jgi:glycosyltransferase involved in cell wall biosynthesis